MTLGVQSINICHGPRGGLQLGCKLVEKGERMRKRGDDRLKHIIVAAGHSKVLTAVLARCHDRRGSRVDGSIDSAPDGRRWAVDKSGTWMPPRNERITHNLMHMNKQTSRAWKIPQKCDDF